MITEPILVSTSETPLSDYYGKKAVPINVYRSAVSPSKIDIINRLDSLMISCQYDYLLIISAGGYIEVTPDNIQSVVRVETNGFGYKMAKPVCRLKDDEEEYVGPMAGGNFLWSCDSRFSEGISHQPIPIHDRWETADDYEMLSH